MHHLWDLVALDGTGIQMEWSFVFRICFGRTNERNDDLLRDIVMDDDKLEAVIELPRGHSVKGKRD